jgi:hypothetical protein
MRAQQTPSMNLNSGSMSTTWLGQLWKKSRLLCMGVVIFFSGTVLANLIQLETTPFIIWDMYKDPVIDTTDYQFFLIQYNNSRILNFDKTWKETQRVYLSSPLLYYINYKKNNDTESSKKYLEEVWAV